MCRTTNFYGFNSITDQANHLNIKAFHVRFSGFKDNNFFPKSLSILYYSMIRPDPTTCVTLHRVVNVKNNHREAVYMSMDRVRVSEGDGFVVYLDEERILEGNFGKEEENHVWKLDTKCRDVVRGYSDVAVADVYVGLENEVALTERVEMAWKTERRRNKSRGFHRLQVIPEEGEEMEDESDGKNCCGSRDGDGSDSGDLGDEYCGSEFWRMEMDLEGVRWAVDVGLWVMCLGVGLLVSRASAKSLTRSKIL